VREGEGEGEGKGGGEGKRGLWIWLHGDVWSWRFVGCWDREQFT